MASAIGKSFLTTVEGFPANISCTADGPATEPAVVCGTSSEQDGVCFLDIVMIALDQASEGKWYASTLQLRVASFEVCAACRSVRTLRVTVDKGMPLSLWGDDDSFGACAEALERRRLPALRAAGVRWKIVTEVLVPILTEAELLRGAQWMQVTGMNFTSAFLRLIASPRPADLKQPGMPVMDSPRRYFEEVLAYLDREDHSPDIYRVPGMVYYPVTLRQLSLGCTASDRVEWAALPSCLERLALGGCFYQSIQSVSWPVSLKHLTLGGSFNRCIANVKWPTSLLELTFGDSFDQPIDGVEWPETELKLSFGDKFSQPMYYLVRPSSLLQLTFGVEFNATLGGIESVASLQRLAIKGEFNLQIDDIVWPNSLLQIIFGYGFNKPIAKAVWPASLEHLEFGLRFNQSITDVVWPLSLKSLVFGREFAGSIQGIVWPDSLRSLAFGDNLVQRASAVAWPLSLEPLVFRDKFYDQADGSDWPFGKDSFDQPDVVSVGRFYKQTFGV